MTVNWQDAVDSYHRYRTDVAGRSAHTVAGEMPGLRAFTRWAGEQSAVTDFTPEDAESWWLDVRDELAVSTVGTRLSQLRSLMDYCTKRGWLDGDPTALLEAPYAAKPDRARYTPLQLLELQDAAASPRDRILIALGNNLALRGGEISRLRVRDYSPARGVLRVVITKTRDVHDMPVSLELSGELEGWLRHYQQVCPQMGRDSYLVPARHWSGLTNRESFKHSTPIGEPYEVVKAALERCGHPTDQEGVHTLRRSVALIFFEAAEADGSFDSALLATMTLLHHSRPETTLGYLGKTRQRSALDRAMRGRSFLGRLAAPVSATPALSLVRG